MREHYVPPVSEGKVLFLTDSHWRDTDKKSIKGYLQVQEEIADEITELIISQGITHLVHTGDLTDKGYRKDQDKYSHTNRINYWNKLLNGNLIMAIGNHFFLERDANPELYWIQPHEHYQPTKKVFAMEPSIKTPREFHVGPLQVSLFHFDRTEEKSYYNKRQQDVKIHVGVYHDDVTVPNNVRLNEHIHTNVTSQYLNMVYSNIDHAIHGHIHTPYDTFVMQVNGRDVLVDVPGSAMITKKNEMHESIKLPIYTVKDGKINLSYYELSLRRHKLRFQQEKETLLPNSMFVPEDLKGTDRITDLLIRNTSSFVSCETFLLMEGATQGDIDVYRAAVNGALDLKTIVASYKEE